MKPLSLKLKILIGSLIFATTAWFGLTYYLNQNLDQARIREFLGSHIRSLTKNQYKIGLINLSLWRGVVVKNITLSSEEDFNQGEYLLKIPRAVLVLNPLEILAGERLPSRIRLEKPRVFAHSANQQQSWKKILATNPDLPDFGDISGRDLIIENGALYFGEPREDGPVPVRFDLELEFGADSKASFELSVRSVPGPRPDQISEINRESEDEAGYLQSKGTIAFENSTAKKKGNAKSAEKGKTGDNQETKQPGGLVINWRGKLENYPLSGTPGFWRQLLPRDLFLEGRLNGSIGLNLRGGKLTWSLEAGLDHLFAIHQETFHIKDAGFQLKSKYQENLSDNQLEKIHFQLKRPDMLLLADIRVLSIRKRPGSDGDAPENQLERLVGDFEISIPDLAKLNDQFRLSKNTKTRGSVTGAAEINYLLKPFKEQKFAGNLRVKGFEWKENGKKRPLLSIPELDLNFADNKLSFQANLIRRESRLNFSTNGNIKTWIVYEKEFGIPIVSFDYNLKSRLDSENFNSTDLAFARVPLEKWLTTSIDKGEKEGQMFANFTKRAFYFRWIRFGRWSLRANIDRAVLLGQPFTPLKIKTDLAQAFIQGDIQGGGPAQPELDGEFELNMWSNSPALKLDVAFERLGEPALFDKLVGPGVERGELEGEIIYRSNGSRLVDHRDRLNLQVSFWLDKARLVNTQVQKLLSLEKSRLTGFPELAGNQPLEFDSIRGNIALFGLYGQVTGLNFTGPVYDFYGYGKMARKSPVEIQLKGTRKPRSEKEINNQEYRSVDLTIQQMPDGRVKLKWLNTGS